ncbi:MAG: hypothetical protein B7Z55_10350 [Planctomycetales bacterium 12-60-4]|nr:MAG: hypothetical protein B7Z55_10350 [Planctomycetales bacterium 12-60-4]
MRSVDRQTHTQVTARPRNHSRGSTKHGLQRQAANFSNGVDLNVEDEAKAFPAVWEALACNVAGSAGAGATHGGKNNGMISGSCQHRVQYPGMR